MSEPRISRRRLIGAGIALTAAGAGAWRVLGDDVSPSPSTSGEPQESASEEAGRLFGEDYEAIRALILGALPYLILPRETLDDFLSALKSAKRRPRRAEQVTELFLLSTDFFAQGADESRPLRFQTLYDPYINPCYNPMEPA